MLRSAAFTSQTWLGSNHTSHFMALASYLKYAPRRLDHRRSQPFRQLHQLLVREPGADLADGLQLFGFLVVTREQVRAVHARALASAVKRADGDEVEGVAASLEVILLELQPVERSLGGLVRGVHRLDDEASVLSVMESSRKTWSSSTSREIFAVQK